MSSIEPISFSHAEAYCSKCGKVENYNGNKPFEKPSKCVHCGGRMINEGIERLLHESHKLHKIEENNKEFTIKTLESIRDRFDEDEEYTGKQIKTILGIIIAGMR